MARSAGIHVPAVILGVFVDQLGSFALGAAIAIVTAIVAVPVMGGGAGPDSPAASLGQHLYEAACLLCGAAGAYIGACFGLSTIRHVSSCFDTFIIEPAPLGHGG
jgi:hypothetical protein